ncbi:hypothetical protein CR513_47189, partial [Mucuna pruriens]
MHRWWLKMSLIKILYSLRRFYHVVANFNEIIVLTVAHFVHEKFMYEQCLTVLLHQANIGWG